MLSYQTLDNIADSYNPLLGLISFFLAYKIGKSDNKIGKSDNKIKINFIYVFLYLIPAYTGMIFDKHFSLWDNHGLNYSTHTAVALALVLNLLGLKFKKGNIYKFFIFISFFCYIELMIYQKYHTLLDIATTSFALLPFYGLIFIARKKHENKI